MIEIYSGWAAAAKCMQPCYFLAAPCQDTTITAAESLKPNPNPNPNQHVHTLVLTHRHWCSTHAEDFWNYHRLQVNGLQELSRTTTKKENWFWTNLPYFIEEEVEKRKVYGKSVESNSHKIMQRLKWQRMAGGSERECVLERGWEWVCNPNDCCCVASISAAAHRVHPQSRSLAAARNKQNPPPPPTHT